MFSEASPRNLGKGKFSWTEIRPPKRAEELINGLKRTTPEGKAKSARLVSSGGACEGNVVLTLGDGFRGGKFDERQTKVCLFWRKPDNLNQYFRRLSCAVWTVINTKKLLGAVWKRVDSRFDCALPSCFQIEKNCPYIFLGQFQSHQRWQFVWSVHTNFNIYVWPNLNTPISIKLGICNLNLSQLKICKTSC